MVIEQVWLAVKESEYDGNIYKLFYDKAAAVTQIKEWYAQDMLDLSHDYQKELADGCPEDADEIVSWVTDIFKNTEVQTDQDDDVRSIATDTEWLYITPLEIN